MSVIIGTFNGWNIIAMPAAPGFASLQPTFHFSVGVNKSPFTQTSQTYVWPGADLLTAHATLPPMSRQDFAPWLAFLHNCQGQANAFLLSLARDQHPQPQGASNKGVPVVAGTNAPMTNTMTTSGWKPNTPRVLVPGDYLQVGYRLYLVTDVANADSSGHATLSISPSIRETPAAGSPLILNAPKGLFRLSKPDIGYSIDEVGIFGFEMDFEEAR